MFKLQLKLTTTSVWYQLHILNVSSYSPNLPRLPEKGDRGLQDIIAFSVMLNLKIHGQLINNAITESRGQEEIQ